MIEKFIDWLKDSNRLKHFIGGLLIGAGANDFYCAMYAGAGVASAMELKDKLYGGLFDWIDFSFTVAGSAIGFGLRFLLL